MPEIESGTRARIAKFLPKALESAIASYQLFSEQNPEQNSVEFKKHQDACKVGIAHIELLVKLAKRTTSTDAKSDNKRSEKEILGLMETAQEEIEGYKNMAGI
ncbi:MAG: hypothetical protein COB14_06450 [Alphaproteobacteria bacterium]|nr:MAG: hypothetical protein COB14_06450 [Alphaproteobacteria bacterium]